MTKENKFIENAMFSIKEFEEDVPAITELMLTKKQFDKAVKLQNILGLSKNSFFNMIAKYSAYSCINKLSSINKKYFPKKIGSKKVEFELSIESETQLKKIPNQDINKLLVYGLNIMADELL